MAQRPVESTPKVSEHFEASRDAISLGRAMDAGEIDACRADLPGSRLSISERASIYCRLGEAFYYRDRRADAIECARAALALEPEREAVADFCAWLFSNCGHHNEAALAYERLIECRPGWAAGHRHASGSFAVAGELDRAIQHAARASAIEPQSAEFAIHTGCLLARVGLHRDAIGYFSRAAEITPDDPCVLSHLSNAALAADDHDRALAVARRAHALRPAERATAHHLTEVLLRSGRVDEAAQIIATALADDEADAVGYRLLSAAEMLRGGLEEGLDAIDRALVLASGVAEYHLHRGNLLYRLARLDDAAAAFAHAAFLDPENPAPKRSQLTAYLESGRLSEALAVGGELIRTAPDNEDYADALLQVLNRRFAVLDGDYVVLGERRVTDRQRPGRQSGPWSALQTQLRVLHALIVRETRTRFGDSTLGYGWALLEPILHILMLFLAFGVLMHGRPPIGTQFFIFYYTGLIPYYVFIHTSSSMTHAVIANGALLQLPLVGTFDVILARGLLELATDIVIAVILLALFGAVGLGTLPHDLVGVMAAVAAIWVLACGCGFINVVVTAFFKSWDKIWVQLVRVLYFCSGIFYVPGMMPDRIRDLLVWNPVLQGVDWFRTGFFFDYAPHWLDRTYLASAAGAALLAGLALERGLRRHLCEPL